MTTETIFVRKPCTLADVVRGTAEIRAIRAMRGDSGTSDDDRCTVAAEKHLTAAEWADFTGDFFRDRDWLANFARQNVGDCIRVTGDGAQLALIVDPQGYGYARYVGIAPTDCPRRGFKSRRA